MTDEDFETVDSNVSIKPLKCNLKEKTSEKTDMSDLDGKIESMLNSSISLCEIDETEEIDYKTKHNEQKVETSNDIDELEIKLKEIQEEFQNDVELNYGNLKSKALMEASIKGKWISKLMSEKVKEKKLKKNLEILKEEMLKMYTEQTNSGAFLSSRQSFDYIFKNDRGVKELRKAIQDESQIIEFLSYCKEVIFGFGYSIKNSLDAVKLDMGI